MESRRMAWLFSIVLFCLKLYLIQSKSTNHLTFALNREKSYYFNDRFKLNWYQAAEHCRAQDMFLISIGDERDLYDAIDFIKKSGYFDKYDDLQLWTSGNDLGQAGQLYWGSTGQRMSLDRFADGEPSNSKQTDGSTEDCIVFERSKGRNYTFDDRPCKAVYYFMCESMLC